MCTSGPKTQFIILFSLYHKFEVFISAALVILDGKDYSFYRIGEKAKVNRGGGNQKLVWVVEQLMRSTSQKLVWATTLSLRPATGLLYDSRCHIIRDSFFVFTESNCCAIGNAYMMMNNMTTPPF